MAIALAAVYWFARRGFDNPAAPVAAAAALALFTFNAPYVVRAALRRSGREYGWATSYSFLWLAALAITALIGRIVQATGVNPFPVLAIAGAVLFAVVFVRWALRGRVWRSAMVTLAGLGMGGWAAGVVWGRIYKSPLFTEMMALDGVIHHDALGLAALANMIRTYGVASVGLDGLPYMPYHWGTPWLFVQLANLLDMSVLDFYQLGYPVTMIPLFFGGILCFVTELRHAERSEDRASHAVLEQRDPGEGAGDRSNTRDLRDDPRAWAVFLIATIGVIPITAMDAMGVWTSNLMISESYAVGIPVALLLLGTCVAFWRSGGREAVSRSPLASREQLFPLIVLPIGIVILGYLKISLMVLAFLLAVYVFLRLGLFRRPLFAVAAVLLAVAVALAYGQVSLPAHREGIVPLHFLKGFVPAEWWPLFPIVHLFWSILYVGLRLRSEGVTTVGELGKTYRSGRILDVEAVILVAIAGLMPGLALSIDGGSAFYFSDVQRWLSVGLTMAAAGTLFMWRGARLPVTDSSADRKRGYRLTHVAVVLLAIPLLISMGVNAVHWPRRMLQANATTRAAFYGMAGREAPPATIRNLAQLGDPAALKRGLDAAQRSKIVNQLRLLSRLPDSERRQTALFIPQTEAAYWTLLARPGACTFASHVAPALTGMA
ncbi:MAG: hypothetical protein H0U59_09700, partial [Gemmatimonadaceae bacterium]|nr:hypothetical protein [Gemmatimonadaceae bacterium]